MSFDFEPYLASHYPGWSFKTEPLSGGLVNFTVRVRRTSSKAHHSDDASKQDPPATLILKYAPPYVAALGESAPFSQDRQTVEATVLQLFSCGPLSHLNTADVRVPRFIDHDADRFVLTQEDLGPFITLYDLFSPSTITSSRIDNASLRARCRDIGARLGRFFASVHNPVTLTAVAAFAANHAGAAVLARERTADVVFDSAVRPVLERLQTQGGLDAAAATRLYARVHGNSERDAYAGENCLCMGDCHPGSVLISPGALQEAAQRVEVAAIDWEFATIRGGRGVNGDMAQLLASLRLMLMSRPEASVARAMLRSLVEALCESYNARSATGSKIRADGQEGNVSRAAGDPVLGIFRSALILHGREIVNQAVEREWDDGSDVSVAEMVRAGAWYLERAGDDVEDMLESQNWGELLKEEPSIMLSLFGISTWKE